jgi:hypothetical protein
MSLFGAEFSSDVTGDGPARGAKRKADQASHARNATRQLLEARTGGDNPAVLLSLLSSRELRQRHPSLSKQKTFVGLNFSQIFHDFHVETNVDYCCSLISRTLFLRCTIEIFVVCIIEAHVTVA